MEMGSKLKADLEGILEKEFRPSSKEESVREVRLMIEDFLMFAGEVPEIQEAILNSFFSNEPSKLSIELKGSAYLVKYQLRDDRELLFLRYKDEEEIDIRVFNTNGEDAVQVMYKQKPLAHPVASLTGNQAVYKGRELIERFKSDSDCSSF